MAQKSPLEEIQQFAQDALAATPVIILGSGASAAHGIPGMEPLSAHLKGLALPSSWTANETTEWNAFVSALNSGRDLETALSSVRFEDRQTLFLADATRQLLLPADEAVFAKVIADRHCLPLTRLYRHLFSSTHKTIDVITPNYDRIAEYAADAGEFSHYVGFSYGYLQTRSKDPSTRIHHGTGQSRTVCVWKVHGSLDWFQDPSHQIIGARAFRENPIGYAPLMITPGVDKYRLAHNEPFRTILSCADVALDKARAYLCVGYGFNDTHVQAKLVERCNLNSIPLVVIAKALTPTAKSFLIGGQCRRYLALEDWHDGARAYTNTHPTGIELSGPAIWQFNEFLNLTLGDNT